MLSNKPMQDKIANLLDTSLDVVFTAMEESVNSERKEQVNFLKNSVMMLSFEEKKSFFMDGFPNTFRKINYGKIPTRKLSIPDKLKYLTQFEAKLSSLFQNHQLIYMPFYMIHQDDSLHPDKLVELKLAYCLNQYATCIDPYFKNISRIINYRID